MKRRRKNIFEIILRKIKSLGIRIHNFFFCLKYPFWKAYNVWTGKFCGYKFTEYDCIPYGWRKAFGRQLSKELKGALKKSNSLKTFRFSQIKEKYGELCLYCFAASEEVYHILHKYELLSTGYCIMCGKPARYRTQGWIEFYCEDCIKKFVEDENEVNEYRLTKEDIPECYINKEDTDELVEVNLKTEYNIDFYKLWNIDEEDCK